MKRFLSVLETLTLLKTNDKVFNENNIEIDELSDSSDEGDISDEMSESDMEPNDSDLDGEHGEPGGGDIEAGPDGDGSDSDASHEEMLQDSSPLFD